MAPDAMLALHALPDADGVPQAGFAVQAGFDMETVRATLAGLAPGQSWLLRTGQEQADRIHAIGIAMQKQEDGNIRLGLINSNGWFPQRRAQEGDIPALLKMVSPDQAVAAMDDLLSGRLPPRFADVTAPHGDAAGGSCSEAGRAPCGPLRFRASGGR